MSSIIKKESNLKREAERISTIKAHKQVKRKSDETGRQWLRRLAKVQAEILEKEYKKRGFNSRGF